MTTSRSDAVRRLLMAASTRFELGLLVGLALGILLSSCSAPGPSGMPADAPDPGATLLGGVCLAAEVAIIAVAGGGVPDCFDL